MRKLLVLSFAAAAIGGGVATNTAQAEHQKEQKVKLQQKRYYHALGYYHAIWNQAARTVYHPNVMVRSKWRGAVRYLKQVQINAMAEIRKLTTPVRPTHYAGWMCIHRGEGSFNANTGNGYYGGWQQTYPWMGYRIRWDLQDPLTTMWILEREAARRNFSYSWMQGQWPQTFPPCAGYF
jgi:hypothetical protein